jgi:hypothetical protein
MEEFAAKQLLRDMQPFSGGPKATTQWPSFWTCMQAVMSLDPYSPLDGLLPTGQLITTTRNHMHSKLLYKFLLGKLRDSALNAVHATNFNDRGFEPLDHLRQTYAPQRQSDAYANFLGLFALEMGPTDSLDKVVQQLRQYASALHAGGAPLPPKLLTMFFMKTLDDRYELLKQSFVIDSEKYASMSLHDLYTAALNFTTSSKQLLSSSAPSLAFAASASSSTPDPSNASSTAPADPDPPLKVLMGYDIKKLAKSNKCLCTRSGHTLEKCSQFMHAGYVIEHDEVKATAALNQHRGSNAPATTPAPSSSAIGASGHVSAAHISSSDNQYAAMESDSDDDFQDMGVSS